MCYFREGDQGSHMSRRPACNEGEKRLPRRCLSKCESIAVRGRNGKKIGVAGAQRSRGRVLGTDVEKAAKIQIAKDFGGHDKDDYISRLMESFGGLWAGENYLDYSS